MADKVDVSDAQLLRRCETPARCESGEASPEFHSTPEVYYRQLYYEAVDLITQAIERRYNQPGYKTYRCLEDLVLKAAEREDLSWSRLNL